MSGANWERSSALTPLKHDLLIALFRHTRDFFLTGGSALGIFYLDHRRSYDLDLFSVEDVDWHRLSNDIAVIGKEIGADIRQITASVTFRRYIAERAGEKETIDFVRELAPQICPVKNEFGEIRVDTLEEIAVNKWCALLGRSEIKDLVDLYFLSQRLDVWALFDRAHEKEGGVEPSILSHLVSQIPIAEIPDYLIAPLTIEALSDFVARIRQFLDQKSFPET